MHYVKVLARISRIHIAFVIGPYTPESKGGRGERREHVPLEKQVICVLRLYPPLKMLLVINIIE
jgi:hypothetical protein